jgi:hypothetical protein
MFWTFNLSFDMLATVLATFSNIGRIFAKLTGHSADVAAASSNSKSLDGKVFMARL